MLPLIIATVYVILAGVFYHLFFDYYHSMHYKDRYYDKSDTTFMASMAAPFWPAVALFLGVSILYRCYIRKAYKDFVDNKLKGE